MGFVSPTTSSNPCALSLAIPQDNPAFMFTYGNSRKKPVSITLCPLVQSMLSTRRKPIRPSWKTTEHPTVFPASTCSTQVWNCLRGTKICHATVVNNISKPYTKDDPQQLPGISQMATSNPGPTRGYRELPSAPNPTETFSPKEDQQKNLRVQDWRLKGISFPPILPGAAITTHQPQSELTHKTMPSWKGARSSGKL